jgi:uncharacterized protein (UPF0276 family)
LEPNPSLSPLDVGIGLKPGHYEDILSGHPDLDWFEVHTENYMGKGGIPHYYLDKIAKMYPISLHGVGLSLGSAEHLDEEHLARIKLLVDRYQPAIVSEHVAWSSLDGRFHNDLLPLPYTEEALDRLVANIEQFQDAIGRTILIENPSTYLKFNTGDMTEPVFMTEAARRSGCGVILDVNNVHVSSANTGFEAKDYIDQVPANLVEEIHLAGHTARHIGNSILLIDDHGSNVNEAVWDLYEYSLQKIGPKATLIEWDNNIPPLKTLITEAGLVKRLLTECRTIERSMPR